MDKAVPVTSASSGIGAGIARELTSVGAKTMPTPRRIDCLENLAAGSSRIFSVLLLGLGLSLPFHAEDKMTVPHPYVGMWITANGHVRHELLPNGRYDEARGDRESAYQGRYAVNGNHIEYWDDTGFTADGDFVDADTLHHGGMVLRRQPRN